ncbi:MAG: hypothetical protein ACRDQH_01360, partial [Pseudonocardiaceae bacterium]
MSTRTLPGIAAATVGAGVMVLALVGVGGSALAESNPTPKPHTCVEATDAYHKAQGVEKTRKATAKDKAEAYQ